MSRFVLIFLILTGILMVKTTKADGGSKNSEELQQELKLMKIRRLVNFLQKAEISIANPPESNASSAAIESVKGEDEKEPIAEAEAEAPAARKILRHRSSDKSVAGGGVIIGGLVTATFASVYCYIRATRRKDGEKHREQAQEG